MIVTREFCANFAWGSEDYCSLFMTASTAFVPRTGTGARNAAVLSVGQPSLDEDRLPEHVCLSAPIQEFVVSVTSVDSHVRFVLARHAA